MSVREPDLPKDPAEYRPRPRIGARFWATAAFGVVCVLAGEPRARAQALDHAVEAARALEGEPVTARVAGLMARAAYAAGAVDEARVWLARGMSAQPEPDWSDLDPEGRAFAYHAQDWARLAIAYAETGELIHPRLERRERSLRELPELPLAYADAAPLLAEPALYPVDEGY